MAKRTALIVFLYTLILGVFFYGACLNPDAYYYWEWSRHLGLSYFDGPPLIAYALRFTTAIFGQTEFGILSLGLFAVIITSFFLYHSSRKLFQDSDIAHYSVLIWLSAAVTLRHLFLEITYDTTLIIFWAMTFYFFLQLTRTQFIRYYYLCGISIGLMMLSKYTGILLCLSLLLTALIYPTYRFILKNKHFYFSLLLAAVIFSPVVIWNAQHHWISFDYQLNHGLSGTHAPLKGVLIYLKNTLINFNVYFIALLFIMLRYNVFLFKSPKIALITIPTFFIWLFFFFSAIKTVPIHGNSWNAECFFTAALLLGYYLATWQPLFRLVLILGAFCFAATYAILCRFPYLNPLPGWSKVVATRAMLLRTPQSLYQNKVVFHNGQYWLSSFAGFYLKNHPMIYSAEFKNSNEFYFWNKKNHPAKRGEPIIVLSYSPIQNDRYFQNCVLRFHTTEIEKNIFKKNHLWQLYVSQCVFVK